MSASASASAMSVSSSSRSVTSTTPTIQTSNMTVPVSAVVSAVSTVSSSSVTTPTPVNVPSAISTPTKMKMSSQHQQPPPSPPPPSPPSPPSPGPPSPETIFTQSIIPNLPLLMYGSGDAHPTQIDDTTTHLVATLTTHYVQKLVHAAVDAHDILTDGAGGILPPPTFTYTNQHTNTKRERTLDDWADDDDYENTMDGSSISSSSISQKRNRPLPRIKNKKVKTEEGSKNNKASTNTNNIDTEEKKIPDEEWQGVKGIDIYENRIRNDYNSIPGTISAQSFIFPICHDAELYNRVKELTAFEKNELKVGVKKDHNVVVNLSVSAAAASVVGGINKKKIGALIDSTMLDCIREEEGDLDHLANSVFHWVGDIPPVPTTTTAKTTKTGSSSSGKASGSSSSAANAAATAALKAAKAEEKKATEIAIAKRKEMARRLVHRTRLEAQLPGVEDILVPLHSVHDYDHDHNTTALSSTASTTTTTTTK